MLSSSQILHKSAGSNFREGIYQGNIAKPLAAVIPLIGMRVFPFWLSHCTKNKKYGLSLNPA